MKEKTNQEEWQEIKEELNKSCKLNENIQTLKELQEKNDGDKI